MVRPLGPRPPPPPMPAVKSGQLNLPDAIEALQRAMKAWNSTQFQDAIRSAKCMIEAAEKAHEETRKEVENARTKPAR